MINEYFASGKIYEKVFGKLIMVEHFSIAIMLDRTMRLNIVRDKILGEVAQLYCYNKNDIHIETLSLIKQETTGEKL